MSCLPLPKEETGKIINHNLSVFISVLPHQTHYTYMLPCVKVGQQKGLRLPTIKVTSISRNKVHLVQNDIFLYNDSRYHGLLVIKDKAIKVVSMYYSKKDVWLLQTWPLYNV